MCATLRRSVLYVEKSACSLTSSMKSFFLLRSSSSLLSLRGNNASLKQQMRHFGVTITQSSGSDTHRPGPGAGSSLLEASAAIELVMKGKSQDVSRAKTSTVQFVDASWFNGDTSRGLADFMKGERLPGAVFFDIDQVAAPHTDQNLSAATIAPPLPHMLPSAEAFAAHMTALGISSTSIVVVYNQPGSFSAARCWWTFKVFGHAAPVYVLNGGLKAWKEAGGEVEQGPPTSSGSSSVPYSFPSAASDGSNRGCDSHLVADKQAVLGAMASGLRQICDARSKDRFLGRVPEARPGLQGGHIPGSLHLAFTDVLDVEDTTRFLDWRKLRHVFEDAGVVAGSEVIFTCGSGVTAAVLALARSHSGVDQRLSAVYDGSWSEWGSDPNLPKITEDE